MSSPNLPLDLMIDIFMKLPAKSLFRFRFVCKSWHATIRNPNFISDHLKSNSRSSILLLDEEQVASGLYSNFPYSIHSRNSLTLFRRCGNLSLPPVNLHIPFSSLSKDIAILGSCDGLLCVSLAPFGSVLLLWNPTTNEYRPITGSYSMLETPPGTRLKRPQFGFGFDSRDNDYKLVKIASYSSISTMATSHVKVEVYSVTKDCWREIKIGTDMFLRYSKKGTSMSNTVVDGVMYMHMVDIANNYREFMISFDMSNEVFRKIEFPCFDGSAPVHSYWSIAVFAGSLAAIYSWRDGHICLGLWFLKDYCVGVKQSWTKVMETKKRPRGTWEVGEMIYENSSMLLLYDPRTEETHNLSTFSNGVKEYQTKSIDEPCPHFKRLVGSWEDGKDVYEDSDGYVLLYDPDARKVRYLLSTVTRMPTKYYFFTESLVRIH